MKHTELLGQFVILVVKMLDVCLFVLFGVKITFACESWVRCGRFGTSLVVLFNLVVILHTFSFLLSAVPQEPQKLCVVLHSLAE